MVHYITLNKQRLSGCPKRTWFSLKRQATAYCWHTAEFGCSPRTNRPGNNKFFTLAGHSYFLLSFSSFYLFGSGFTPFLVALTFSLSHGFDNTYAGLRNVDRSFIESAVGMGISTNQVLFKWNCR